MKMNERIKELVKQAQIDGDAIHYYSPAFAEKLAELIVQDICDWIDKSDSLPSKSIITTNIKSRYISKHFGIEE